MTRNARRQHQINMHQGYEPGSRMESMTPAERRAFKEWLNKKEQDSKAFERQLR